jgi:plastocyanin
MAEGGAAEIEMRVIRSRAGGVPLDVNTRRIVRRQWTQGVPEMNRTARPRLTGMYRAWALDRRAWQRLAASSALAIAVSTASWGWVWASPADPTASPAVVRFAGHGAGHTSAVYGMTDAPAAGLRVTLNNLLSEHVYLAARATGAALGNRTPEFEAAAAALDANSVDISKAIGLAYGPDAEAAFLPLWRAHIGMVVDYTVGKATNDEMKQQQAVNDLVSYTQDFGAFLSGANENLPQDVVAELVKSHVLTLKDVIDAQATGDQKAQFTAIRGAGHHMSMIADPLAEATAVKFPDKFQGMAAAPGSMPMDHGSMHSPSGSMAPVAPMGGMQAAEIKQFAFQPKSLEVPVGTTVTWTNGDGASHSVTAVNGSFDSGLFGQDGTFSQKLDQPGTIAYVCTRHGSMQGEVKVI